MLTRRGLGRTTAAIIAEIPVTAFTMGVFSVSSASGTENPLKPRTTIAGVTDLSVIAAMDIPYNDKKKTLDAWAASHSDTAIYRGYSERSYSAEIDIVARNDSATVRASLMSATQGMDRQALVTFRVVDYSLVALTSLQSATNGGLQRTTGLPANFGTGSTNI